ncbi:MAG: TonB-Xanth-Caul: TonB-dependent receptor [Gammaproteobacteria bacterium]|nr:TonB-Xanth-Caul: TonB-dependent receptor [Gammaproteobacteria bacterium]
MTFRRSVSPAGASAAVLVGILASSSVAAAAAATESDAASSTSDSAGAPTPADANGNPSALEQVTVLGQRTTPEIARAAQEQALNLINLTTAEEMQKLPDVNTGEAIRRVPGISLETDTGEGRYINIRGLDADLNSTTFGGLRLPPTNNSSPSGAGRAVAFDSIPIGFVGAIKVTKSNLPEQDAEALGGTIDITPKTAPTDGKPFADIKLGTGEELLRHTWITDIAGTAGTRFGGSGGYQPFSVLVTASTYDDRRGVDDAEAGFVDNQAGGTPDKAFAGFEQRYYQYHRERHGYGADLGFTPDDNNQFFARYYDAGYSETVQRNRLIWNYTGTPAVAPNDPSGFVQTAKFTKALRDEKEYLDSRVAEVGGKSLFGANTLDYHVGYTKGTYYKPYDYNSSFDNSASANVFYDNTTLPNWPVVRTLPGTASNGTVTVNPFDPAGYALTGLSTQSQHSNDHEWGIGANLALPTHFTEHADEEFKFGLNARLRNKTGDQSSSSVTSVQTLPLASVAAGPNIIYYQDHYSNGPQIDAGPLRALYAAALASGNITGDPIGNALASVHDKENVYAAYGQYQFGFGALDVVTGVRVERTAATYAGFESDTSGSAVSAVCPILDPVNNPTTRVCPVSNPRNYTNVFPSLQTRYELQPDLVARAAISSTIARPGFQQVTASTTVDNGGNIVTGNPNLKPTTATALDLALEKYLSHAGIASAGFFAKDIKDYIVKNVSQQAGGAQKTEGNLGIVDLISFANAPTSHLYGFETNYVQYFRDLLPGPLAGLGVSANWTWVDSSYRIPVADPVTNLTTQSRTSVLPSTSRNTANAELLYDMYGLNLTLGAYYTSKNIFGVGNTAALDIWTQERFSVDFGSQYRVTQAFNVYFNLKNLTNTPLKLTEGPGEDRIIQREFYGLTVQFGGNYKF